MNFYLRVSKEQRPKKIRAILFDNPESDEVCKIFLDGEDDPVDILKGKITTLNVIYSFPSIVAGTGIFDNGEEVLYSDRVDVYHANGALYQKNVVFAVFSPEFKKNLPTSGFVVKINNTYA